MEEIIQQKKRDDLEHAIKCGSCLSCSVLTFEYLALALSYIGVFISAIATAYNDVVLIWVGLGITKLATLLNTFKTINRKLAQKYTQVINNNINKINANNQITDNGSPVRRLTHFNHIDISSGSGTQSLNDIELGPRIESGEPIA
jgi:hypothetical protein